MNTTTSHFQKKPDYFPSVKACLDANEEKINTNPRYKFFTQTHFTAGDIEQFECYRDASNGQVDIPYISLEKNRFTEPNAVQWEKYKNLDAIDITNTFSYIFHKFKKGIFIKVKNGQLHVFLPFSKKNYVNEWSNRIHIEPLFENINEFIKYIYSLEGRRFFPKAINRFTDTWYSNNFLIRYEFPISEGDTNVPNMSDMFFTLCKNRHIPDMEFFINRRDFPLLKTDGTEPYNHLFDNNELELLSHRYDKYAPILSMVGADEFADIPIPTGEDWARVSREDGKFFPRTCSRQYDVKLPPWEERKSMAVFRGSSTGYGVTIDTNQRLKLSFISYTNPMDERGQKLLDAGITSWNLRPRKFKGQKYLQTIDIKKLPFGLVPSLTIQEQASYKYIINVDGHVSAYRLSLELSAGFCILLVASKYRLWYRHMLKPYVHFVPVKKNLSDLLDKIRWCKNHDKKCQQISQNAKEFAHVYLCKEGILDYLQKILYELKKANGIYLYNSISLYDLQYENEYKIIKANLYYPNTDKKVTDMVLIPHQIRSYNFLKGVEWIISMVINQGSFTKVATEKKEIFNNKLSTLTQYELAGYPIIKKSITDRIRHKEMVHEVFVTMKVTNELLKHIPNFVYVFGFYEDNTGSHMLLEYVPGETLNQYINSEDFNIQDFIIILIQLAMTLHVAQKTCGLVHYDLTPWNIIIQKLPKPATFDYIIDCNSVQRITTQIIPIIIDMGRTHVIYNNNHYGVIHMFQTSTIRDLVILLITSLYTVSNLKLCTRSVSDIIILANFLSGNRYRSKPFSYTGVDGLGDIRFFFSKAKKYTELVTSEKYELEQKTPLDFINYILKNFKYKFPIERTDRIIYTMTGGDSHQVFDYVFASNIEERALTFISVFHRAKCCELPETPFLAYYTLQSLSDNLHDIHAVMIDFLRKEGVDIRKYSKVYHHTLAHINRRYRLVGKENSFPYEVTQPMVISFHSHTFLYPQQILELLIKVNSVQNITDLTPYKDILEQLLLHHNNRYNVQRYNFKHILDMNTLQVKTAIANIVTLRNLSALIYKRDLDALQGCSQVEKFTELYKQILNIKQDDLL